MEALIFYPAVAAVGVVVWLIRRRPKGRMVECASCGRELPVKRAVVVHGSIDRRREGFATTVAEYHPACARRDGVLDLR